MELYAKFLKERENLSIIKTTEGFISYKFFQGSNGRSCCLIDTYYILPEYRQKGKGRDLADRVLEMCVKKGIETVYCQSDISAKGHRVAALTILNYGFDVCALEGKTIHYFMEVAKWAE